MNSICFFASINGYQITFFQTVHKNVSLTETKEALEHVSFYRKQPSQTKVRCPICSEYRSPQSLTRHLKKSMTILKTIILIFMCKIWFNNCCSVHSLSSLDLKRSKVEHASDQEPVQLSEIDQILDRFQKWDCRWVYYLSTSWHKMIAFTFDRSDTGSVSMKPETNMVVRASRQRYLLLSCTQTADFASFFSEMLGQSCPGWKWNLVHPILNLAFIIL